ncbi:MAG: SOS response-associated peptidase family protein [Clostridia bacterium]|nr:SOS response-associated peptidase family protein [Clostridia bacterium]
MCGRFHVDVQNEWMAAIIQEACRRQRLLTGQETLGAGEVFPGQVVAALAVGKKGQGAYPMRWGFSRPGGRGLLINVRSETALKKFENAMRRRRCLVPMCWYDEWQALDGAKGKLKYAIRPRQAGQAYLAAIYRYEEGSKLPVLSILTREAAPGIAFIHSRMPVILPEGLRDAWLAGEGDPDALLKQCETDMECRMEEGSICPGM